VSNFRIEFYFIILCAMYFDTRARTHTHTHIYNVDLSKDVTGTSSGSLNCRNCYIKNITKRWMSRRCIRSLTW